MRPPKPLAALSPTHRLPPKSSRPPRHTRTKSRVSGSRSSPGDDDSPVVPASCYSSSNSSQEQQQQQQLSPRSRMKKSQLKLEAYRRSLSLKRHPSSPSTASAYVHNKTAGSIGMDNRSRDGGQAAADALMHDLEEMGYNLNCESFITRSSGSSIAAGGGGGDADERYGAPRMLSVGSRNASFFDEESSSGSNGDDSEYDSGTLSADVAALLLDSSSSEEEIADLLFASSSEEEMEESTLQRKSRRNKFRLFGGGPRKQQRRIDSRGLKPSLTESNTMDDHSEQEEVRTMTNKKKKKDKSMPRAHNHRKGRRSTTTKRKKKEKKGHVVVKKKNPTHQTQQESSSTEESADTSITDPVKAVSQESSDSSLHKAKKPHQKGTIATRGKHPVTQEPLKKGGSASSTSEETAGTSVAPDHEISVSKKVSSKGGAPEGARSMSSSAAGGRSNTPSKLMRVSSRSPSSAGLATNTPSKILRAPAKGENGEPVATKTQNEAAAANDGTSWVGAPEKDAKAAAGQDASPETATKQAQERLSPKYINGAGKIRSHDRKIMSVSSKGFSLASLSNDDAGVEQVFIDNMSVVNEFGAHSVSPDYIIDGNAADDERESEVKVDSRPNANQHVLGNRVGSPVATRGGQPIARKKSVRIKSPASIERLHAVQEEEPELRDEAEVEPWLEIDKTTGKPMVREQTLPTKRSSGKKPDPLAARDTGGLTGRGPAEDVGTSSPDLYNDLDVAPRDSPPHKSKSPRRLRQHIRSRSWNNPNKTQQRTTKTSEGKKAKIGARIGHFFKKGAQGSSTRHEKHGGMVAIRVIEEDGGIDLKLLGKNELKEAHTKQQKEGRPVPEIAVPPKSNMTPASSRPSKSQEKNQTEAAAILPSNSTILSELDSTNNLLDKNGNVQLGCARVPNLATAVQTFYQTGCESNLRQITGQHHAPRKVPNSTQAVRTRSGVALATSLCYQCNDPGTSNGIFYLNSDDAGSLNADVERPLPPRRKFTGAATPKPLNDIGTPKEAVGPGLEGIEVPNLPSSQAALGKAKWAASNKKSDQYPPLQKSSSNASDITLDTISQIFAASYTSHDGKGEKAFHKTLEGKGKRGFKGLLSNGVKPKRTASAPPVVHKKALEPMNTKPAVLNLPPPPANRKHMIDHPNATYSSTNNRTKPPTKLPSSLRQPRHSVNRNPPTSSRNPTSSKTAPTTHVVAEKKKDTMQMVVSPSGQVFRKQVSKPATASSNHTLRSDMAMAMAYPIEFNDDNCTLNMNSTGATAPHPPSTGADRMRSMESINNAAQLRQVMAEVKKKRAESITPVVEQGRSRTREKSGSPAEALADLLITPKPTPPSSPPRRDLVTPQSPLADQISESSWNEVNEAASLLGRAMSVIDSVKSEDTVNDADNLHKLLSQERDLGGVEHALHTLKKHADRMGLRESDLLIAAVRSEETNGSVLSATTGQISVRSMRSMTIGEELTEIFNMFIGRPASKNRKSRSFLVP